MIMNGTQHVPTLGGVGAISSRHNMTADATLRRMAEALERIAVALETLDVTTDLPEPVCEHPASEREPSPLSTMTHVIMRCKQCGEEGIEA